MRGLFGAPPVLEVTAKRAAVGVVASVREGGRRGGGGEGSIVTE